MGSIEKPLFAVFASTASDGRFAHRCGFSTPEKHRSIDQFSKWRFDWRSAMPFLGAEKARRGVLIARCPLHPIRPIATAQTGEEIRLESDSVEIDDMRYVRAPRTKASFIGPLL